MATLLAEATRAHPEEACGLLLGDPAAPGRIIAARPCANVAADRRRRFEIDPAALIAAHKAARGGGPALVGYWHSHPDGHPLPSATDCEHAGGDGAVWAILAGSPAGWTAGWFRDGPQGFTALPTRLVDG